ncbi:septum site-determining protein MinC [Marinobacter segnicrescens]|uniref:Probable septum site-determining protein MinC n=1 Tax=Marinobacter segnicrescens TaxID=430453 RepID=A0A1I0B456_9GAMM|nr:MULTISPECIES: septum site-determining protein MinC [Marinobacter]UZD66939.1 septum site-determining protein MinC [Marinobacter sp. AN1]SET01538.1 septum site-determining protein MinC [Marinobacter segnicrescens]
MTDALQANDRPAFQLKGTTVSLTALELAYFDEESFEAALREKIRQAPGFFRNIPILISLDHYQGPTAELDFFKLLGICRRHDIHVVGVRGGDEDQRRLARHAAIAVLPGSGQNDRPSSPEKGPETGPAAESGTDAPNAESTPANPAPARIVSQPVRSGQQVYAPEGDLIILAPVQAGAEVLAAGNIHVYGPLRGRALAGVHGQEEARVFCQSLEAELVSIAGHYKISEDLQERGWKAPVQIQLRDDLLVVTPLDRSPG